MTDTWFRNAAIGTALLLPVLVTAAEDTPPTRATPLTHSTPLEEYVDASLSGGPGKDGIPSIDEPAFWSASAADAYLDPGDVVFGVHYGGVTRAYPQRILVWHEIVNDDLGGTPVSITYCPLTGTALGFLRGDTTLGVSGRLVNSNLIMYDRATDSLWPQVLGTAVEGDHAGRSLQGIQVYWTTWERWRERFPDTRVLSTDTGHIRDYQRDPYGRYNPRGGYYSPQARRLFPVMNEDSRHPPKTVFLAARAADGAVAFHMDTLREQGTMQGQAGDQRVTAVYLPALDTGVIVKNPEQRPLSAADVMLSEQGITLKAPQGGMEPIISFEAMWFAYAAFYPEGAVYD
jgi:hypothetical protein